MAMNDEHVFLLPSPRHPASPTCQTHPTARRTMAGVHQIGRASDAVDAHESVKANI